MVDEMKRRSNHGLRKVCSCPVARRSKCIHPWHFNYRTVRCSVDVQAGYHVDTKADAEALARVWRDQIDGGVFVQRERGGALDAPAVRSGLTLDAFATAHYLPLCSALKPRWRKIDGTPKDKHPGDYYTFQPLLAFALPDGRRLGALPFAGVTETMLEQYVAARREDVAASTVNHDVQLIKAMCRWAVRRKLIPADPISGDSRILVRKDPARRHRAVTDADLEALRPHVTDRLWAMIELALITCLRLTELYRLVWADLQADGFHIRPDATKVDSAARVVPLDARATTILEFLRVDPAGRPYPAAAYVFGECGEIPVDINDRFTTALLKAFPGPEPIDWRNGAYGPAARRQLDRIDLMFGDLRHEGALRKYRAGWGLNEVQALLGHTNLTQTSTYLGVGNEEIQRAMARHGSGAAALAGNPVCNLQLQSFAIRAPKGAQSADRKRQLTN